MRINDHGKLLLLTLLVLVSAVLAALHVLEPSDARLILVGVFGYVTGNGVLAVKGQSPSPAIGPRNDPPAPPPAAGPPPPAAAGGDELARRRLDRSTVTPILGRHPSMWG